MSARDEKACPDAVLGAIAWYPDQLDDARRALVESHAAECAACREELLLLQGEIEPEGPVPDADDLYRGVLARIEQSEAGRGPAPRARTSHRTGRFVERRAALAAGIALALLAGLAGVVGGMSLREPPPSYETVSETPGGALPVAEGTVAIDVVFRPDATVEDLRAALRAVGGQIVSGPSEDGVYRVGLAASADQAAAARVLRGEERGVATFAEPAMR